MGVQEQKPGNHVVDDSYLCLCWTTAGDAWGRESILSPYRGGDCSWKSLENLLVSGIEPGHPACKHVLYPISHRPGPPYTLSFEKPSKFLVQEGHT